MNDLSMLMNDVFLVVFSYMLLMFGSVSCVVVGSWICVNVC